MNRTVSCLRLRKDPRDPLPTTFSRQKVQTKSGETLVGFFSLWAGHQVTDEDFYQLYKAVSRMVLRSQFTKDQPMRGRFFSQRLKGRRREGIGCHLGMLPNRSSPRSQLGRAA